jgi:hypothetical protein
LATREDQREVKDMSYLYFSFYVLAGFCGDTIRLRYVQRISVQSVAYQQIHFFNPLQQRHILADY